ncbi:helix-turn-helix domain-containing protein [Erythrobacter sp. R86502]|uniref:helix-turn-helix domain-containing protein n=1 Tax=Erythrobacter sp. R86502 TaxID=3093846 RepID=UPI0036D22E4B
MAIKAHLDTLSSRGFKLSNTNSERSAQRRALRLETSGFVAGAGEANVTIHNISAAGLLIETELSLAEGEQLALDLPEAGAVTAVVVWRSERLYGCAFEQAIGPAALAAAQLRGLAPRETKQAVRIEAPAVSGELLGPRLNRLRREAGLTLADLAATLGVSKPTVWAWEKGKARPLPERVAAIADALGVTPDTLAAGPEQNNEIRATIAECRDRIAAACGTTPQSVKIMIEL